MINDVDESVAIEVAKEIQDAGHQAIAVIGNCAHRREADHLVSACIHEFGKLDILVNNAGTTRDKIFHRMDEETLDVVINANLRTTFNATQAAIPHMRDVAKAEIEATGTPAYNRKIVNTSSVVAFTGNPGQWNYTAAKGAVLSVTKTLARELGPFLINVNAVAPGFVETRLTAPHGSAGAPGVRARGTRVGPPVHAVAGRPRPAGPARGHRQRDRLPGQPGRRLHHGRYDSGHRRPARRYGMSSNALRG